MNTVLLCITGSTEIIPAIPHSEIYKDEYMQIQALLEEDVHNGKTVIIVAAGNNSYSAAKLAIKYQKKCYINGHLFDFVSNSGKKVTQLEAEMLLTSQCTEEVLFKDSAIRLLNLLFKQTPNKYSLNKAKEILDRSAPRLTLSNGKSSFEYLLSEFDTKLAQRRAKNLSRIQVTPDGKDIIELEMNYDDAAQYIFDNPNAGYALTGPKGIGKTEVIKRLVKLYEEANKKTLVMTSTITLTNALCSDERNYKKALEAKTIDKQNTIFSCLYSALLTPAFKSSRENAELAIFEEYESCRDALLADIVGKTGSLEEKAKAQSAFNHSLKNTKTVVLTDAHLSQQSADHFVKRTGRQLVLIKPIIEHKRPAKKLTYFANRNVAIQNIRNTIDGKGRALTFSDCKHSGGKSKFRAMDIEINKGFDIKNIAVDASFFAESDNMKHMQNPTDFVNKYDHVLSTSVWKNGISMFSKFDLLSMIGHQTVALLDMLQWSDRDRLNLMKALHISDIPKAPQIHWNSIFYDELKKGILSTEVENKEKLLKNNDAARDVIDRIKYNNEMRQDYANNVLSMFEIQGYEIEYNYQQSSKALNKRELNAKQEEKLERLSIYRTLDALKEMELEGISEKEDELRQIDEKRLSYADNVFRFYGINSSTEEQLFNEVFNFDADGYGRTKIDNLYMANNQQTSRFYMQQGKAIIIRKLFDCLGLNKSLNGEFSKQNYDEFFNFLATEEIDFGSHSEKAIYVFKALFPHIKISTSAWIVKNLLKKEFGLEVTEVKTEVTDKSGKTKESKPTIRNKKNGKTEYLMQISEATANELLRFYDMAYPQSLKSVARIVELNQQEMIELNAIAIGEDYSEFDEIPLDQVI